jgi:hypothetical protein
MPAQLGRNQGFSHAGAFTAAILIGGGSRVWGYDWIFYLVCVFAAGMVAAAFRAWVRIIDSQEKNRRVRENARIESRSWVRGVMRHCIL